MKTIDNLNYMKQSITLSSEILTQFIMDINAIEQSQKQEQAFQFKPLDLASVGKPDPQDFLRAQLNHIAHYANGVMRIK
jgi:hypothetical protein